jgi:GNAT superfamily N-acetyltransferase
MRIEIAEADPRSTEAAMLIRQFVEEGGQRYGRCPRTNPEALWPERFDVQGRVFALVWLDNRAVRCGALVPIDRITTEFRRLYVIPDFRRHGLAAKLIRWLEDRAQSDGFRSIRLMTGLEQSEAIALYERLGYYLIPSFPPWENDPSSRC